MSENIKRRWTPEQERFATSAHGNGMSPDSIAAALGKTPGMVRYKLNLMGVAVLSHGSRENMEPQYPEEVLSAKSGDLAFKQAMLAAIRRGTETPIIGVMKAREGRKPHYVPTVRAVHVPYRSSALMMAEIGGE